MAAASARFTYDTANADEVSVAVSGGLGETDTGGPVMNLVPRSGGNSFSGQSFYNTAGKWSSSNNVDDDLRGHRHPEPGGVISAYDASVALGGPILRDKLWFFGSYRQLTTAQGVEGIFGNVYAFDPAHWDYLRDESLSVRDVQGRKALQGRATAQLSTKNRRHVLAPARVPLPGLDGDAVAAKAAAPAARTGWRWARRRCRRRRATATSSSRTA